MKKLLIMAVSFMSLFTLTSCSQQVVNVYTTRHYDADQELYDLFEEETGIKVNVVYEKSASTLIEKIKAQGEAPQADVFMTADAGNLASAKTEGVLQSITSTVLDTNIPARYQDSDNQWFGLTKRYRVFLYDTDTVTTNDLTGLTYESLATSTRWNNKLVARSSSNIYNQSLVASMFEVLGSDAAAQTWTTNLVNQFARTPEGNDRDQALEVHANDNVDIAIANSYYYGKLVNNTDDKYNNVTDDVEIFIPNQGTNESGAHVNISGAGIINKAANKDNGIKLLEFLSEKAQQEKFSATNYEFPVNETATVSTLLQGWLDAQSLTTIKEQELTSLSILGDNNSKAVAAMTTANWDN